MYRHSTIAYFGSAVQVQRKSILSAALLMCSPPTWVCMGLGRYHIGFGACVLLKELLIHFVRIDYQGLKDEAPCYHMLSKCYQNVRPFHVFLC